MHTTSASSAVSNRWAVLILAICAAGWMYVLGFPLIDWDSIRYLELVSQPFKTPETVPVLQYLWFAPATHLLGAWALPILCNILLLYTASMASIVVLGRIHPAAIIAALVLSGAHLWMNYILVDAYFAIGLLATFCAAHGRHRPIMIAIFVYACVAHSANLLSLPPVALAAFAARRQWRVLGATLLFLAIVVFAIGLGVYRLYGSFAPLSLHGSANLVARVMADFPGTVDEYAALHPESGIARHQKLLNDKINDWKRRPDLQARIPSWFPLEPWRWPYLQAHAQINLTFRGHFKMWHWPKEGFSKEEQRDYVLFVFKSRPLRFCWTMMENLALFLVAAATVGPGDWPYQYAHAKQMNPMKELVYPHVPKSQDIFGRSLQIRAKGNERLLALLYPSMLFGISFGVSLILNCMIGARAIYRQPYSFPPHALLAILAVLGALTEAFVMANVSSMHPRYYTIIYFPMVLATVLALARLLPPWAERRAPQVVVEQE